VKRLWFALVAASLTPVMLAGQQDVSARLAGHVPPAVVAQVQRLADTAVARGLPVDPLVNKALEGAVKGALPDKIVSAVRAVLQQLDLASDALRPVGVTSANAIEAGAFAVAAGWARSALRATVATVPILRRRRYRLWRHLSRSAFPQAGASGWCRPRSGRASHWQIS